MIEFSAESIKKAERLLGGIQDALPQAQVNAINRSLEAGRAEAVRSITKEYIIRTGDVRKAINIKKAILNKPTGAISSVGSPIALSKFNVSAGKPGKKAVLTAQVKRSGSRKPIKKAFIATANSGHVGVYIRAGKARLPLVQLHGPSIPQMMGAENVIKKIEARAAEILDSRMEHEISRVLDRGLPD